MTHTYEIQMNGFNWEGEVDWGDGKNIKISTSHLIPETHIDDWQRIVTVFRQLGLATKRLGQITKFEILEK